MFRVLIAVGLLQDVLSQLSFAEFLRIKQVTFKKASNARCNFLDAGPASRKFPDINQLSKKCN
jgi:hypothetical protein